MRDSRAVLMSRSLRSSLCLSIRGRVWLDEQWKKKEERNRVRDRKGGRRKKKKKKKNHHHLVHPFSLKLFTDFFSL